MGISEATPQRVMIFIDAPNILSSARRAGATFLRFDEMASILVGNQNRMGCNCYVRDDPDRQRFYGQLERLGLNVVRVSSGKSVDGRLIFDMLIGAIDDSYDIAILCSGDRDYMQVVQRIKQRRKSVWVASFSNSVSQGLKSMADRFINLDEELDRIRMERSSDAPTT